MQLTIKVKQPGSKHDLIGARVFDIEDIGTHPTVQALISAVVRQQVDEYNNKSPEKNILPFLSETAVQTQSSTGKIGFGSIYNENKADPAKAVDTAIRAFEDGLFALFVEEEECTSLGQSITLSEQAIITFIRLTFLAGSYW